MATAGTTTATESVDTADISDFTAFADLASSDVQGWVEAAMGEELYKLKDGLDAQIEVNQSNKRN